MPLGLLGVLINGLPLFLSNKTTHDRTSIPEFVGSVKSNLGSIFYLIFALIVLIPLTIINWKIGLIAFSILILSGLFALYYWDRKLYWKAHRELKDISEEKRQELISLRKKINETI